MTGFIAPRRLLGLVILLAILFIGAYGLSILGKGAEKNPDPLTFSNTTSWEPALLERVEEPYVLPVAWEEHIDIPPPPSNLSRETLYELQTLLSYKMLRTEETLRAIGNEKESFDDVLMAGFPIGAYFDETRFPKTAALFIDSFYDISTLVLKIKRDFNRVRPHVLEPRIEPTIEVPGHPAYPSGHATQAYFLAYLIGELRPEAAEDALKDAAQIALHREIAGVHYPSDSEVGRLLAQQFIQALFAEPLTATLLEEAQSEWQ